VWLGCFDFDLLTLRYSTTVAILHDRCLITSLWSIAAIVGALRSTIAGVLCRGSWQAIYHLTLVIYAATKT
jgi:hypothetical protein